MHNNSRIYVLSGSASGIGRATKELLVSQGHRVIGVDLREADVIADLGTPAGRDLMIDQVTKKSRGKVDALLAVAGVDIAGPPTIAINYYGALATLEGLRPLLLKSSAPRAVAVSSITSVHPFDQQLLDGTEEEALQRAEVASDSYATSKRALSRWIRRVAINAEWAGAGIPLNAIAPVLVKTKLLARLFEYPETKRRISARTPMPLGGPFRVAERTDTPIIQHTRSRPARCRHRISFSSIARPLAPNEADGEHLRSYEGLELEASCRRS
jgi:NAD(P)-dependent dehydrogenase (short-subunit alcohol dehydrogenase family)